ncbi:replication factor C large subunit [Methanomicrobium sp. W14]|uniref:replication factor C large subunit n=1 Tax=Methanomicrobium sp. W14 TaxID=2817839 RepID=UPI001AE13294|nr:replication factor C large subunit [Methanomicrobium sp. W14]MBP2133198.1 replication factor C large subunit [Methanomicrobium sp. W14]
MKDWVEKYRPKTLGEIVGNKQAVRQMAEWAKNWRVGSPPLLIYGKPGIGKTSSAYALASDMNWEVVELNASDQRTKGVIERIAGSTATTMSLTGSFRKLLLLDEADNLHGTADRGGARAIMDVIKNSRQPIILIANDLYGVARELKALCEPVQFRALQSRSIFSHLKYICSAEKKVCSDEALTKISESSAGDMRSAVNMLFAAGAGTKNLTPDSVSTAGKDERATIFELVGGILHGKDDRRLMEMSYELSDTPDTIEQWIEGSLHQVKDDASRSRAYGHLSFSDDFIGRTYKRQYYTLWRYATSVMVLGTSCAVGGQGVSSRIMPPSRWGRMSGAKKQKQLRQSVLNKLSATFHIPEDTLRDEYVKPVSVLADISAFSFAKELSLDRDELDFLIHDKKKSSDIIKQVKKEEREAEKKTKKSKIKEKEPGGKANNTDLKAQENSPDSSEKEMSASLDAGEKKSSQTQSTLFSF